MLAPHSVLMKQKCVPSAKCHKKLAPRSVPQEGSYATNTLPRVVAQRMPDRPVVPFQGKSQNRVEPELLTEEIWPTPLKFRPLCQKCINEGSFRIGNKTYHEEFFGKASEVFCADCGPLPLYTPPQRTEFPETDDEIEFLFERTPGEEESHTHTSTPETDGIYEGDVTTSDEDDTDSY